MGNVAAAVNRSMPGHRTSNPTPVTTTLSPISMSTESPEINPIVILPEPVQQNASTPLEQQTQPTEGSNQESPQQQRQRVIVVYDFEVSGNNNSNQTNINSSTEQVQPRSDDSTPESNSSSSPQVSSPLRMRVWIELTPNADNTTSTPNPNGSVTGTVLFLQILNNDMRSSPENDFDAFLNHTFQLHQQQNAGPPPASKSVIENLERIANLGLVTNKQSRCPICFMDFDQDDVSTDSTNPIVQLECEHYYHIECVKNWLKDHNTCPVCRYELQTDDTSYEVERIKRMSERKRSEQEAAKKRELESYPCELAKIRMYKCEFNQEDKNTGKEDIVGLSGCEHHFHRDCIEGWGKLTSCGMDLDNSELDEQTVVRCPRCRKDGKLIDKTSYKERDVLNESEMMEIDQAL